MKIWPIFNGMKSRYVAIVEKPENLNRDYDDDLNKESRGR